MLASVGNANREYTALSPSVPVDRHVSTPSTLYRTAAHGRHWPYWRGIADATSFGIHGAIPEYAAHAPSTSRYTMRLPLSSPPSAPVWIRPLPARQHPFPPVFRCSPYPCLSGLLSFPAVHRAAGSQKPAKVQPRCSLLVPPSVVPLYFLACLVLSYNCAVNADGFKLRFRRPLRRR